MGKYAFQSGYLALPPATGIQTPMPGDRRFYAHENPGKRGLLDISLSRVAGKKLRAEWLSHKPHSRYVPDRPDPSRSMLLSHRFVFVGRLVYLHMGHKAPPTWRVSCAPRSTAV